MLLTPSTLSWLIVIRLSFTGDVDVDDEVSDTVWETLSDPSSIGEERLTTSSVGVNAEDATLNESVTVLMSS